MSKDKSNDQVLEEKTLEEAFTELDGLAEKLEDRETSLEDSFRFYRQGMELLKFCSEKLDTVEKKMLQINEDGTFSEFSGRIDEKNQRNRSCDQGVSSCGRGPFQNHGSGYELQYAGRRQAPSSHADAGNFQAVWRQREAGAAFYGRNGDDPYPFSDP